MKFKQEARVLKGKALSSMTSATEAFNSPVDCGRSTKVLLFLQHSFEMLLKAALVQNGVDVFDAKLGRSIGFEACVGAAINHSEIKLSGTDAMHDDEQHWFNHVSEQLLYMHARGAITLFDDLLQKVFGEPLAKHLPTRVLPVTVEPPQDLALLLDEEYAQIAALLQPNRRASHEAGARIRTLLALEAHTSPATRVSRKDVARVRTGIRNGAARAEVFPRLQQLATAIDGEGLTLRLRFVKNQDVPAVRYEADENVRVAAIREVDLQAKFHRSAADLAQALDLTLPRCLALRRHLGIDENPNCCHEFVFGKQRLPRFSDNAYTELRKAMDAFDMTAIWDAHRSGPGQRPSCTVAGCQAHQRSR